MEVLLKFPFHQQGSTPFWVALSLLKPDFLSDSSDRSRQRNPAGNRGCPCVPGTAEFQPQQPQEVRELPAALGPEHSCDPGSSTAAPFQQGGCDTWRSPVAFCPGFPRVPATLGVARDRSPNWIIHLKPSRELHKHRAEAPL